MYNHYNRNDYANAGQPDAPIYTQRQLNLAVAAERERCAKLCQQMDSRCPDCAAHNDHAECDLPTPDAYAEMLRRA